MMKHHQLRFVSKVSDTKCPSCNKEDIKGEKLAAVHIKDNVFMAEYGDTYIANRCGIVMNKNSHKYYLLNQTSSYPSGKIIINSFGSSRCTFTVPDGVTKIKVKNKYNSEIYYKVTPNWTYSIILESPLVYISCDPIYSLSNYPGKRTMSGYVTAGNNIKTVIRNIGNYYSSSLPEVLIEWSEEIEKAETFVHLVPTRLFGIDYLYYNGNNKPFHLTVCIPEGITELKIWNEGCVQSEPLMRVQAGESYNIDVYRTYDNKGKYYTEVSINNGAKKTFYSHTTDTVWIGFGSIPACPFIKN